MVFSLKRIGADIVGRLGLLGPYSVARRALTNSQVAILMYHEVCPEQRPWYSGAVKPAVFEKEIRYMSRVGEILPLEWLVNQLYLGRPIPKKAFCITFDDGYKGNYTEAFPILRKYNVPATIFLTTGYIGDADISWWGKVKFALWNTKFTDFEVEGLNHYKLRSSNDKNRVPSEINHILAKLSTKERLLFIEKILEVLRVNLPDYTSKRVTMSWDEVLKMSRNDISFGAHTVTHPLLTKLPTAEIREEIQGSKKEIEARLGKPCTLFAYPNGDFNAEIVELVAESGFNAAVTIGPKLINNTLKNLMLLPRVSSGPNYYTFLGSISGLYPDLMTILRYFKKVPV